MVGALALLVDAGFIMADAPGAELDTALRAGLLGLLFIGPGRLSVDGAIGIKTATAPVSGRAPRRPCACRAEPVDGLTRGAG